MTELIGLPVIETENGLGDTEAVLDEKALLKDLEKIWTPFQQRGLEARWQVGNRLNRELGKPTKRLPHGQRVLKKLGKKLQIAECDLSRMRWFSFLFKSVQDFKKVHPDLRSWGKIKTLLAELNNPEHGQVARSPAASQRGADHTLVLRKVTQATEWFQENGFDLDEDVRNQLREAVEDLLAAVSDCLRIGPTTGP